MDLFNSLAVAVQTIGVIENVIELDWLGKIIQSLIEGCQSIGLGIIVFTLILKLITLPFDIFSRVSTKKSSVMMEKMRPELERLQRQYANNQELYQRKMQDLYKKNGYSPFSACLPTLLNLIVFIVVIGQFSTYSNYANFDIFCSMSVAYEQAVEDFNETNEDGLEYVLKVNKTGENGEITEDRLLNLVALYNGSKYGQTLKSFNLEFVENDGYNARLKISEDASQTQLEALYGELEKGKDGAFSSFVNEGVQNVIVRSGEEGSFSYAFATDNQSVVNQFKASAGDLLLEFYGDKFINEEIKEAGRTAAAERFRTYDVSFLWVKNIWSQDIPWEHPVKDTFASYNFVKKSGCFSTCSAQCNGIDNTVSSVTEVQYKELTAALEKEKSEPNGYLILVVLSIGIMLVQQLIMQKQQKTQTQLGSVDGENGTAAQSQKMMTWMMPIMFGFFSFMYTASFSIYIIISSVFSLLANFIINFLVDKRFEKLAQIEAKNIELKRTGRINEIEQNKGKNKKNKK